MVKKTGAVRVFYFNNKIKDTGLPWGPCVAGRGTDAHQPLQFLGADRNLSRTAAIFTSTMKDDGTVSLSVEKHPKSSTPLFVVVKTLQSEVIELFVGQRVSLSVGDSVRFSCQEPRMGLNIDILSLDPQFFQNQFDDDDDAKE
jgi:hypothetical protein